MEVIDGDTDIAISQLTKAQSGGSLSLLPPLGQLFLCWVEPHDLSMVQQLRDVHTNTNLGDKKKRMLSISIPHFLAKLVALLIQGM